MNLRKIDQMFLDRLSHAWDDKFPSYNACHFFVRKEFDITLIKSVNPYARNVQKVMFKCIDTVQMRVNDEENAVFYMTICPIDLAVSPETVLYVECTDNVESYDYRIYTEAQFKIMGIPTIKC